MEKNYILQDLIRKRVAIICHSTEDVFRLSEMVETLYPGYGRRIRNYGGKPERALYLSGFAIRLEEYSCASIDLGYDSPAFYVRKGIKTVEFSDLDCDLGEFDACPGEICSLLFGTIKA